MKKNFNTYLQPRKFLVIFSAVFFLSQILNLLRIINFSAIYHYLPHPFVLNKANTFMDFYNPLSWLINGTIYNLSLSVYPPLNFLFVKAISIMGLINVRGPILDAEILRNNSSFTSAILISAYCIFIFISIFISYNFKNKSIPLLMIGIGLLVSPPVLFALERGNLIILALLFLALYINEKINTTYKLIILAILINIKPYFAIFFLLYILKPKFLFLILFISFLIFVLSGILIENDFLLFFSNLLHFGGTDGNIIPQFDQLTFPSSIVIHSALAHFFPNSIYINLFINFLKYILYITILYSFVLVSLSKIIPNIYKIFSLVMIITNYSVMSGGYSFIFYTPFIFVFLNDPNLRKFGYYLLIVFIPLDFIKLFLAPYQGIPLASYLSIALFPNSTNHIVLPDRIIHLGTLLRPFFNFLLFEYFIYNYFYKRSINFKQL